MTNQDLIPKRNLDGISGFAFVAAFVAALSLYLLFYVPGIAQGVRTGVWPAKEVLWLEIHMRG